MKGKETLDDDVQDIEGRDRLDVRPKDLSFKPSDGHDVRKGLRESEMPTTTSEHNPFSVEDPSLHGEFDRASPRVSSTCSPGRSLCGTSKALLCSAFSSGVFTLCSQSGDSGMHPQASIMGKKLRSSHIVMRNRLESSLSVLRSAADHHTNICTYVFVVPLTSIVMIYDTALCGSGKPPNQADAARDMLEMFKKQLRSNIVASPITGRTMSSAKHSSDDAEHLHCRCFQAAATPTCE